MRWRCLENSLGSLRYPPFIELWTLRTDKLLAYVVGRPGSVVRLTVSVPSHHTSVTGTKATLLDSFLKNVDVVTPFSIFVDFLVQTMLLRAGEFLAVGKIIITLTSWNRAKSGRVDKIVSFDLFCKVSKTFRLTPVTL